MWVLSKIPQTAHFYWGSPMLSWLRYLTLATFRKQNPDWTMKFYYPKKVYTGGQVENQGFAEQVTGVNYFNKIKEIPNIQCIELDFDSMGIGYIPDVFRSDILRLKLLGTEGGLWSDMDILYFKPMSEICFNTKEQSNTDTVISFSSVKKHYSIGFLMSSANNVFFQTLYVKSMELKKRDGEYQHLGITLWHRFFSRPNNIKETFPQLTIVDIDMWLCYFYNSFQFDEFTTKDLPFTDNRTIAFHFYAGHPRIVPFESKMTPDNYLQFNNTISSTIQRALQ